MKTNFKKFNKVPLFISILFFLFTISSYVFIYRSIQKNNESSDKEATEFQVETSKREEIKSLDRTLKATADEQSSINTHFIKSGDIVPLLDSLEKSASLVKIKAEVTQVDVAPDNRSLIVGVKVAGTFQNIYKFITLIENSNYQLEVVSMDMQRSSESVLSEVAPVGSTDIVNPFNSSIKIPQWSAVFKIKLLSYLQS